MGQGDFMAVKNRPKKLYKIGEIMRFTDLSRQTVHNYTMMGLITEAERTESGHRLYSEDVFDRIEEINRLKKTMTLQEIRNHILDTEEE